jgi:hypothetical protein
LVFFKCDDDLQPVSSERSGHTVVYGLSRVRGELGWTAINAEKSLENFSDVSRHFAFRAEQLLKT